MNDAGQADMADRSDIERIEQLLVELEARLKSPGAADELAERGVNTSLALVAVQGVRAYVRGDKAQAAEDLGVAAEEIRHRAQLHPGGDPQAN